MRELENSKVKYSYTLTQTFGSLNLFPVEEFTDILLDVLCKFKGYREISLFGSMSMQFRVVRNYAPRRLPSMIIQQLSSFLTMG